MAKSFQKDTGGTLTTGLVSYYKLGDASDFYGSNGGTVANMTFNSASGKVNNGASFNGSSSKITLPTDASVGTITSIAFWIKTSQATRGLVWNWSNAANNAALFCDVNGGTAGKIRLGYWNGSAETAVQSATSVNNGAYHFVVITRNGANASIYLDGSTTADATTSSLNSSSPGTDSHLFGVDTGGTLWFNGLLDEFGIWTKVLSSQEITDLYNGGNGQTMNPPIEFDNATNGGIVNPGTSLTYAHVCGTGSNRLLHVEVFDDTGGSSLISGVTYGGAAMTKIGGVQCPGDRWVTLWELVNPATGSNNVVVSASSSCIIDSKAVSWYGARQTTKDSSNTGTATSAGGLTLSTTSVADNCWTIAAIRNNSGGAATKAAGTQEWVSDGSGLYLIGATGPISPAGSTSLGITVSGTFNYGMVMASFAPVAANRTDRFFMLFDNPIR